MEQTSADTDGDTALLIAASKYGPLGSCATVGRTAKHGHFAFIEVLLRLNFGAPALGSCSKII